MSARNRHLPRDLSWPLSPNDIRTALGAAEMPAVNLQFDDRPWSDGTLLHAEWIPPLSSNHGTGTDPGLWNSVRIRIAPITDARRGVARLALLRHALPELAAWTGSARRAPEGWTLSRHSRSWRYEGRAIAHRDDHQPYG
ncbi:hypothetical protein [Streptomyces yangpuensis]|uniref:hypothetical protein n=1 Tax=Streptomyces yangpuensis TaxID=1648182 RepID=UPI003669A52D